MPATDRDGPAHSPGLRLEDRLCRAELHLECMETSFRAWHQFCGRDIEELVDYIAERIGIEVWYTSLPRSGRFSPLLPAYYDKQDLREVDVPEDLIPRFVHRAHHHDILVVAAYKMNLFPALGKLRKEWLIRDMPDGREIEPNEKYLCHNSGFGDWLIAFLKDQVSRYHYDGLWFDDTQYSSRGAWPWPAGCLCPSCRELYARENGMSIPERIDGSDDFHRWVNWRYENLRAFQLRLAREVRLARPGAIVVYNSYPRAGLHWGTASDLEPADPEVGYFIETDYRQMGATLTAKIARARGTCEIWGWAPQLAGSLSSIGAAPYLDGDFCTRFSLTAFANGVHVQGITDYVAPDGVPALPFAELRRRRGLLGGRSIRQCAVHLSRATRDFGYALGPTLAPDAYWRQLGGVEEMLEQCHVVHDLLFDSQLSAAGLEGYRILVLPSSSCLSDRACQAIGEWVHAGGTLLATYESSLRDEMGHERPSFGLADVLGVDYQGTYDRSGSGGTIYVPQGKLVREVGGWIGFAGQHCQISVRPRSAADTEILCTLSTLRQFRPIDLQGHAHDSGHPGVTRRRYGKGRAIYVSGDIGCGFADHPLPAVRRLFGLLAGSAGLALEVEAPSSLFVTAFVVTPGVWNIHLYQRFAPMHPFDGSHPDVQQWAALEEPVSYRDVRIRLPGRTVVEASEPLSGRILEIEGSSTVAVPEVCQHAVIRVGFVP